VAAPAAEVESRLPVRSPYPNHTHSGRAGNDPPFCSGCRLMSDVWQSKRLPSGNLSQGKGVCVRAGRQDRGREAGRFQNPAWLGSSRIFQLNRDFLADGYPARLAGAATGAECGCISGGSTLPQATLMT